LGLAEEQEEFVFIYDLGKLVVVAMADGSVEILPIDRFSPAQLGRIFEIGGCTPEMLAQTDDRQPPRRLNWPNIAALAVWLLSVGTLLVGAVRSRKARSVSPSF